MYYDINNYVNRRSKNPDKKLEDHTELFLELLKRLANKPGFGGIMWIIGTAGAGKSAFVVSIDLLSKNVSATLLGFVPCSLEEMIFPKTIDKRSLSEIFF
ncbi:unnamed protein product [marine sediment metagenome]|uniref:Uncharacterized protein n=1 Tax=marine sediment metagenome TaxID=412755 RepID=X1EP81_9ZZZZ